MPRKVEVSHRTIIFTFFVIGAIWFFYEIRDVLLVLFVALLIMVILNPLVKKISKFRVPRVISIFVVYLIFLSLIVVSLAGVVPALIDQTTNFMSGLPNYIENLHIPNNISSQISTQILSRAGDLSGNVLGLGVWFISNIATFLTILTFAFYLLMARNNLDKQLSYFLGEKKAKQVDEFVDELETKLGGWARGELILMLTVGFFNYLGLMLLGIPYALPLGIFAGLLEIVPYIGPILGAVPAVAIGFGISPVIGVATLALAFLIQQVENYVLAPKIMEKSVGVAPIITLLSLTIGFRIAGVPGVLISVPVVITLQVLIKRKFLV